MTRTVIALYDDFDSANAAVRDLIDNGFSRDDISLIANDQRGQYADYLNRGTTNAELTGTSEGAGVGAGIGAVIGGLGGLLIGLGALTIPGIGPVIAAGPLAAALTGLAGAGVGAVAGGVTGGLIGALVDMGVPEETAQYYAEGVRRGGHLVTVRTPDHMSELAVDILNAHNPVDVNERATSWREGGWTGFNQEASPYTHAHNLEPGVRTYDTTGTAGPAGTTDTTETTGDYTTYNYYEPRFRDHFATTYTTGYTYEQYAPAYRYGYDLATDEHYRNRSWNDIEPEARVRWNQRNPGTWDEFKDAVHHAYDEVKDRVS
jgi:hypothetical protein